MEKTATATIVISTMVMADMLFPLQFFGQEKAQNEYGHSCTCRFSVSVKYADSKQARPRSFFQANQPRVLT
ncbi:MAG: hypothetical protein LBM00_10520 [Deltaproteobacteria bacterium]|jgi:hypothetical protein|nr:hypothetical protein [Deltaproteobacteria bacterium]